MPTTPPHNFKDLVVWLRLNDYKRVQPILVDLSDEVTYERYGKQILIDRFLCVTIHPHSISVQFSELGRQVFYASESAIKFITDITIGVENGQYRIRKGGKPSQNRRTTKKKFNLLNPHII